MPKSKPKNPLKKWLFGKKSSQTRKNPSRLPQVDEDSINALEHRTISEDFILGVDSAHGLESSSHSSSYSTTASDMSYSKHKGQGFSMSWKRLSSELGNYSKTKAQVLTTKLERELGQIYTAAFIECIQRFESTKLKRLASRQSKRAKVVAKQLQISTQYESSIISCVQALRKIVYGEVLFAERTGLTLRQYLEPCEGSSKSLQFIAQALSKLKIIHQKHQTIVNDIHDSLKDINNIEPVCDAIIRLYTQHLPQLKPLFLSYVQLLPQVIEKMDSIRLKVRYDNFLQELGEQQHAMSVLRGGASVDLVSGLAFPIERLRMLPKLFVTLKEAGLGLDQAIFKQIDNVLSCLNIFSDTLQQLRLDLVSIERNLALISVHHVMRGNFPSFLSPNRQIKKVGPIHTRWSHESNDKGEIGSLFLFSDMIAWTGKQSVYLGRVNLECMEAVQGDSSNSFVLRSIDREAIQFAQLICTCESEVDCEMWISEINKCSRKVLSSTDRSNMQLRLRIDQTTMETNQSKPIEMDYKTGDDVQLVTQTERRGSPVNRYMDPVVIIHIDTRGVEHMRNKALKGKERVGPIVVHNGDLPLQLAQMFLRRNGIDDSLHVARPLAMHIKKLTDAYAADVKRRKMRYLGRHHERQTTINLMS